MSKTLKKALAIVLTVLMIVSTMPIAFAVETAVEIEHQPTSGEPFVKLSEDVDATYLWRYLVLGSEITPENAESCNDGENYASYNAETGWSPIVWENGLGGNHFVISLDKGQKITLKLDGFAYTIGIWNDTIANGDYEYNVDGGLVTFEAPATGDYYTYYYGPVSLNIKAYNGEYSSSPLVTQKEATLKNPVFGVTYLCRVTLADGTPPLESDSFEYGYAITHQPTVDEPFVELNEDTDATYQWKTVTDAKITLDDTVANPTAYVTKTTYDAETGWNGDFWDETGAYFFGVRLEKGQKIYADFGEPVSGEIGIWDVIVNNGIFEENGTQDGKIEFTAPWDGYFEFYAYGVDEDTRVNATTDGYKYDNIDNATDARYISTEDLVFACEVTFADGTTVMSETFKGAHGHHYEDVVTAPTCTENGYTTYTCACGDSYKDSETPATGHDLAEAVKENEIPATCTEDGSVDMVVYCKNCGDERLREHKLLPKGHTPAEAVDENYVAPTCTETGSKDVVVYCSACDTELSRVDAVIPATGHSYASEITTPATHTTEGVKTYTCSACEDTYTETIEKTPDHMYEGEATPPTCTEAGYTIYTCVCGDTYTADEVSALGHTITSVEAKAPTCTEAGYEAYEYCSVCDYTTFAEVPATGHTPAEEVEENRTEPTCTTAGSVDKVVYCSVCNEVVSKTTETLETVGHNYENTVKAPTCTEGGYTTYTCSVCGDTYNSDEVAALGHTPAEAVEENKIPATCEEDGSVEMVVYCSVCDTQLSREEKVLPKTEHTPAEAVEEIKTPATCEEAGVAEMVVYCSACDEKLSSETVTLEALGHEEEEIDEPGEEPTCTRDGYIYKVVRCKNCHEEYSREREYTNATGHKNMEPVDVIIVTPTCTEPGKAERVVYCEKCNAEVSSVEADLLPTGHTYDSVVTAPTCTEGGYTTYTCACGDTYVGDEVAATGHTYTSEVTKVPTHTETGVMTYTCACGDTYTDEIPTSDNDHSYVSAETTAPTCTEAGVMTYTCACGDTYTEEIPATGHALTTVEAKAPTCTEAGYEAYEYCTACDYTTFAEVTATGHTYDAVVTAPTCTEDGYTTYTCSVCGDTYDGDEVPALGHAPENAVEENKDEPTCTADGSVEIVVYCAVCDAEISREEMILDKTGHTPEDATEENKVEPTCTEDGSVEIVVYCATCDAEISRDTEVITKTGHTSGEEVEENKVAPTCTADGSVEVVVYCATCDTELSRENEVVAKTGHTPAEAVDENYVAPTCTETGSKDVVVYCSVCDTEISRDTVEVETSAHPDEENDGWCDECGAQYCDHACHQTGFAKVIYVIVLIFQMLFGANQYCDCGVAHY